MRARRRSLELKYQREENDTWCTKYRRSIIESGQKSNDESTCASRRVVYQKNAETNLDSRLDAFKRVSDAPLSVVCPGNHCAHIVRWREGGWRRGARPDAGYRETQKPMLF